MKLRPSTALVVLLVVVAAYPISAQDDQTDLPFFPEPLAPGPCPTFPVVQNFDLHKYLGRWYEIERFLAPFQTGDCATDDYSLFPNGSVSVIITQVLEDGSLDSEFGKAELGPNPNEAMLTVDFPNSGDFPGAETESETSNYNVVATDYHNYAVVYSCTFIPPSIKQEFSWILARRPQVPPSFLSDLKAWLKLVNINPDRYSSLRQDSTCDRRPLDSNSNFSG